MKAIPGFPDLKVHQWMPTLMSKFRLSKKPKKTEHIYQVAFDCCKNARARRQKKLSLAADQAAFLEVVDPVQ